MDRKIIVIALVLIVATPILIGYGTAFEDVTRDVYEANDTKNITELLVNGTDYSYIDANTYVTNSRVWTTTSILNPYSSVATFPSYYSVGDKYTSIPYGESNTLPGTITLADYSYYKLELDTLPSSTGYITMTIHGGSSDGYSTPFFNGITIDNSVMCYTYNFNTDVETTMVLTGATSVSLTSNGYSGNITIHYVNADGSANKYADFVPGFNVYEIGGRKTATNVMDSAEWIPKLEAKKVVFTVDLESLTKYTGTVTNFVDAGYRIAAYGYTQRADSTWDYHLLSAINVQYTSGAWNINDTPIMRGEPGKNVWQFIISNGEIIANYVGAWPNNVGVAYAYQTITVPYTNSTPDLDIMTIWTGKVAPTDTERMRVDGAIVRGMSYPVIQDQTYSPTLLNASSDGYETTISKVGAVGGSIEFAGNTYDVSKGRIEVGSTYLPLEGLTFRSEKQSNGTFVNYIGGKRIAGDTASVPSIVMNGSWSMIVQTTYFDKNTVTTNEWQPGEFAWNGVDSSFAIMGLITCAGVFVGLGMYGKRSGAKVGTLMLICGGAALIFLALI